MCFTVLTDLPLRLTLACTMDACACKCAPPPCTESLRAIAETGGAVLDARVRDGTAHSAAGTVAAQRLKPARGSAGVRVHRCNPSAEIPR
jgi:hypothetical protein